MNTIQSFTNLKLEGHTYVSIISHLSLDQVEHITCM